MMSKIVKHCEGKKRSSSEKNTLKIWRSGKADSRRKSRLIRSFKRDCCTATFHRFTSSSTMKAAS